MSGNDRNARTEEAFSNLWTSLNESLSNEIEASKKVVMLNSQAAIVARPQQSDPKRDWSATAHLIEEAQQAMRISEERVTELESRLKEVIGQAREEISQLTRRAEAAEQRLTDAENQLRDAQSRAEESDAWLHRIHNQMVSSFAPILRERG